MKTRVYIDGYNLYFGRLKHTPYKWLDLRRLIEILIVRSGQPNATLADIHPIKYITAEINPKAAVDTNSLNDQRSYHNALYLHSPEVKIIKGAYSIERNSYPLVQVDENSNELEPRDCERALVWKMEEKQSDVNVALEAVYDAITDAEVMGSLPRAWRWLSEPKPKVENPSFSFLISLVTQNSYRRSHSYHLALQKLGLTQCSYPLPYPLYQCLTFRRCSSNVFLCFSHAPSTRYTAAG